MVFFTEDCCNDASKISLKIMKNELKIKLGKNSYKIHWQNSVEELKTVFLQFSSTNPRNNIILTDTNIYSLYKTFFNDAFGSTPVLTIPEGERAKSFSQIESLATQMLAHKYDRNSCIWAIGGGVTGDIAGFLASIYMRGIQFIQVPTTLLAMVDSSVGGKTGVNLPKGKNMLGTFYQPSSVYVNLSFINTLPDHEIRCGLAEVVKSALIKSKLFFRYIEDNVSYILNKNPQVMQILSQESIKIKAWVVEKDERESSLRGILNFGHTLGHAIESWYKYTKINHGEAVSIGMAFASYYSWQKGYITEIDYHRILELLRNLNLPMSLNKIHGSKPGVSELVNLMSHDKKNRGGQLKFVFIHGIGRYGLPETVTTSEVTRYLEKFMEIYNK